MKTDKQIAQSLLESAGITINGANDYDIQIHNDRQGKPVCLFLNGKGRNINVYISISHVKTYAVASAVVTKKS